MKGTVAAALLLRHRGQAKRRSAIRIAAAAVVAAMTAVDGTHAATITVKTLDNRKPLVVLVGEFQYGDEIEFKARTDSLVQAIVAFQSPGGNAKAGMEIGRAIRAKKFTTFVGDTTCSSACAVAWLGGIKRYMTTKSRIGFHAVYTEAAGEKREDGYGNAMLGAYATEMGLPLTAVEFISIARPNEVAILTKEVADEVGIDVEIYHDTTPTADVRPAERPPAEPIVTTPPVSGDTAALALGLGTDNSITAGWAMNHTSMQEAQDAALSWCVRNARAGDAAKAACKTIVAFHARCVSVAWTPSAPGPRAYGWSLGATQQDANSAALSRCQSQAGYERAQLCTIRVQACDNVVPAYRPSTYQPPAYTQPPQTPATQPPDSWDPAYDPDDPPQPTPPAYALPPVYVPPPVYYVPVMPMRRYVLPMVRPYGGYRYKR